MKYIAMYLPQYYRTDYNDRWWGEGYTDWVAARKAKPFFKGHMVPEEPLNDNYYDLSDPDAKALKWQADLAKSHGIYGFAIYHYWFRGRKVLEKPPKILLDHPEIDINYSFCWDNNQWTKSWYGNKKEVIISQDYGDEEVWKQHFFDLLPFFRDERYIKKGNKPVFHIYAVEQIPCLREMAETWNNLAKENGFNGVYIIACNNYHRIEDENPAIDAYYNFEPNHAIGLPQNKVYFKIFIWWKQKLLRLINRLSGKDLFLGKRSIKRLYDLILTDHEFPHHDKPVYPGICVNYDDTPRRQADGMCYAGNSPELFGKTLRKLREQKEGSKDGEFLYINAWNEWGECAHLEPDKLNGYGYLEAVKLSLE